MTITEVRIPSGIAEFTLSLPIGAKMLKPYCHGPYPTLVLMANPKPKDGPVRTEDRTFRIHGQSNADGVPDNAVYIGSLERAGFPYHVFEVPNKIPAAELKAEGKAA
jgi:hypothetical protein